ncbi:MAG: hypothetical protein FWH23_02940 [Bacteroidales bacterium]|nr:hypothetical protein [Bacteroidales bacterium]MCL2133612.1 hypothetical protein [Bacteroidales bacterium]
MIVFGGGMTSLANILNRMIVMGDFWAGFFTGMSLGMIIWGVVLLLKEQPQAAQQEQKQERDTAE